MKWIGDADAIRYAQRDLSTVDAAVQNTRRRDTVIQAGGNLGVFAKHLSSKFKRVLTFEPHPEIFRKMCANVPEQNVFLFQAALGSNHRGVSLSRSRRGRKENLPPHDGVTHVSGSGDTPTIRVDDLELDRVDLIILDLEGMELPALQGSVRTIERCRPVLMVEINENCRHYGFDGEDVRTSLRIADYKRVLRAHSDEIWVDSRRGS